MRRCFIAILQKEFRQILRDPMTLASILLMPIMLLIIFGYTIKNEIENTHIAVLDYSKSYHSRQLINTVTASGYFSVHEQLQSEQEVESFFRRGAGSMVLVIPENFNKTLTTNKQGTIQLIMDASDLNVSTTLVSYLNQVVAQYQHSCNAMNTEEEAPVDIRIKMQYNPRLESAYMFIPGNIALIMILVTSLMTSITLSKEREMGSWRLLAITPTNQFIIVLGKIIPYMILSLICTATIIVLGVFIFNMPMNGNIVLLLLLCFLFMFNACAFGVLTSVFASTQQVAMLTCMLGLFLPTLLLSGFIFPIENMPWVLRILSHVVPAKWFILALRDIMIKGAGLELLWLPITILSTLTILSMTASVKRLSMRIM
ncbi:MAG: ABC transporter permease [Bacteroidales bacterium]|jgi:ABC-2 type transport system permease protein|nr:ABC transporter permease [Bacteroidales bacterium]